MRIIAFGTPGEIWSDGKGLNNWAADFCKSTVSLRLRDPRRVTYGLSTLRSLVLTLTHTHMFTSKI